MNILHTLAQSYYSSDMYETTSVTSASSADTAAALAILAFVWGITIIFTIITYVIVSVCLMRIFKKAGAPGWAAWVPIYNTWKLLEIGGQQGFWAVLAIIPFVNIVSAVFIIIAQYHIGLKLGKSGAFVAWAIFLPIVWFIWLAFDKSTWNDGASSAPTLGGTPPTPPAAPIAPLPPTTPTPTV